MTITEDLKYSKYFATFDIEVFFPKCELPAKCPKLEFTAQHQLLSVSVASNVPGYLEPKCFVVNGDQEKDGEELVKDLVTYLNEIGDAAYELEQARYAELRTMIRETLRADPQQDMEADDDDVVEEVGFDGESSEEEDEGEVETNSDREFINDEDIEEEDASFYRRFDLEHSATHPLPTTTTTTTPTQQRSKRKTLAQKLINELDEQLRELTVIGFHSGTYDFNVLKKISDSILGEKWRSSIYNQTKSKLPGPTDREIKIFGCQ